jgi:hypothetical protein
LAIATGLAVLASGGATLFWVARRERARIRASRAGLLDRCRPLFEAATLSHNEDGFPRLDGVIAGRRVVLDLVPDSLTLRRLPQLWLSLTLLEPLPEDASFGVLVRPTGSEFYALTPRLPRRLEPPAGLPDELVARGSGPRAQRQMERAAIPLRALLGDARVKEVAATRRGLRAVVQLAEGRRGPHLLLRQQAFDCAPADPAVVLVLHDRLHALADAIRPPGTTSCRGDAGHAARRPLP